MILLLLKVVVGLLAFVASAYALAWAVWGAEPVGHWKRWRWQNEQLRNWNPPDDE